MTNAVVGALRINLGLDSAEFERGLTESRKALIEFGRDMQDVGARMSTFLTLPIGAFGALTVRTAANFEEAMNRVRAALQPTASEFEALNDIAREYGATTAFSATQSAEAIEILAKNGLDASQILGGALGASLTLAAASGADMAQAGDIATDVMLQFGKGASELGTVVDGITGVLIQSKFGIDDYALALAQAGGVAGGLGMTFEDFNAGIAATSSLFASGSDAGTSFKTFLTRLVPATAQAEAIMKELGLSFFDASGRMITVAEMAGQLERAFAGLSQEAMNEAMKEIFGTDAMRTAIGLMATGEEGVRRVTEAIAEAVAADQAAARMEGFNGAMRQLRSAFEEVQLVVADSGLLGALTDLVQGLAGVMRRINDASPAAIRFAVAIAGVLAAIGPLLSVVGGAAIAFGTMGVAGTAAAAGLTGLVAMVGAFWPEVSALATTISAQLTPALNVVGSAMQVVRDNLDTLAVALTAAGTALAVLYAPAALSAIGAGLATLATIIRGQLVAALLSLSAAAMANPFVLIAAGVGVAVAAIYEFRDEIKDALGVDVVEVARGTANFLIGVFRGAVEGIQLSLQGWRLIFAGLESAAASFGVYLTRVALGAGRVIAGVLDGLIEKTNEFVRSMNASLGTSFGELNRLGDSAWMRQLATNSLAAGLAANEAATRFEELRRSADLAANIADFSNVFEPDYVGAMGGAVDGLMQRIMGGDGTDPAEEAAAQAAEIERLAQEQAAAMREAFGERGLAGGASRAADAMKQLKEEGQRVFEATRTPLEQYNMELERLNMLLQAGAINQDTYGRAVKQAQDAFSEAQVAGNAFAQTLEGSINSAFDSILQGTFDLSKTLRAFANDVARMFFRRGVSALMDGIFGGLGGKAGAPLNLASFITPRAMGGPIDAGRAYLVGERGPELVVPRSAGTVIPNHDLMGAAGGGNVQVNIINNAKTDVRTRERQTAGGKTLDVIVDEMVADKIGTPGSASRRALQANGGLSPQLARR